MQTKSIKLVKQRLTLLPIAKKIMCDLGVKKILASALKNERYADAIDVMTKNALTERGAPYRVGEWANEFDHSVVGSDRLNDDIIGHALE